MISKGKKYKFKRINGLADIEGYILFEDNEWFTVKTSDLLPPEIINKQYVHTYMEVN